MRQRVDKVEGVEWMLLKPMIETKNRGQNKKNKCIKAKKGEGRRDGKTRERLEEKP
jgi:hypothetical protein